MTGTARSNHPDPTPRIDNVRRLQRKLWAAAKQSEGGVSMPCSTVSAELTCCRRRWKRVRANRGAAGVDRLTLEQVEGYGWTACCVSYPVIFVEGRYCPAPARRVEIPKPDGGKRPWGYHGR